MKNEKKYFFTLILIVSFLLAGAKPAFGISIPGDTSVGTWDPTNRIYTLTTDVTETLNIKEGNLTLDGNGHSPIQHVLLF